jgi:RNA polymerase sigma factor (sigma-70 family)
MSKAACDDVDAGHPPRLPERHVARCRRGGSARPNEDRSTTRNVLNRSASSLAVAVAVGEREIVQALLARDEIAFTTLVNRLGPSMNRVAALYVGSEEHFFPADHRRWAGAWTTVVRRWDTLPEERLLSAETLAVVRAAAERLPPLQRAVVTLRDIEGWPPEEVCALLGITDGNQRVLLYRARVTVRQALERHLPEEAC